MLEPRKRLLEAYAKKLSVAEKVYSNTHDGDRMSYNTKVTTAVLLNNVSKFLKENWDNSVGVQRSNLGDYKKFCLTVTNVAFPSLIAEDLVLVRPMTSFTGYVAYRNCVA